MCVCGVGLCACVSCDCVWWGEAERQGNGHRGVLIATGKMGKGVEKGFAGRDVVVVVLGARHPHMGACAID